MNIVAQDSITLGEAIVSTHREEVRELLTAQRLEGSTLQRLGGVNIADALRQFSGVQLKDYGGIGGLKTINVRGMGTQHVSVFFDGVVIGNTQNGQVDLGRFSLDNMDALTLYNGNRLRLLQSAREATTASAVYLESRSPSFASNRQDNLHLRFRYGSSATVNPLVSYEHRFSSRLSASISTEWMYTTGRYNFRYRTLGGYDTTAVRHNGDVQSWRTELGLFGLTSGGSWRTKAYIYTSERGLPGAVVRNRLAHEDRQWDTNLFLQSSMRHRFSERYALLVQAKGSYDYLHYLADPARGDLSVMFTDNVYRHSEGYLTVAQEFDFSPSFATAFAVDYAYDHVHANLYRFAFPTRHNWNTAISLRTKLGALEVQSTLSYVVMTERVRQGRAQSRHQHFSPMLHLFFPVSWLDGLQLYAFYKGTQRLPTMMENYYTIVGASALRPETAQQLNLGGQFLHENWNVKAEVYYNRVQHKIIAIPTSNMFRWTMLNLGRVSIRGMELGVGYQCCFRSIEAQLRATYTYERALDITDRTDAYYRHQIPYIPRHSGSVMAEVGWRNWVVTYSFIYTGERYEQRANLLENFTPAWYTSDFSLNYTLKQWQLTAQVSNLFNQRYEVVRGYPMPGVNFKLTAIWRW